MAMAIRDWPAFFARIFEHLVPGGWVELSEQEQDGRSDDGSLEGSALRKWFDIYISLAPKAGLKFVTDVQLKEMLKEAGFVDVSVTTLKMPWGPWAKGRRMKELGLIANAVTETSFEVIWGIGMSVAYFELIMAI